MKNSSAAPWPARSFVPNEIVSVAQSRTCCECSTTLFYRDQYREVLYEVTALLLSRRPLAYILILMAETESHIRGLDDLEQGGLSIRMVL